MRSVRINSAVRKYSFWLLALLFIAYCIKQATENGDFKVFLEAAKLITLGESPYTQMIEVSNGNKCQYFYSPLWAVLLVPFSYLPKFIPNILWLALNTFLLYRIWILIQSYFSTISFSKKSRNWILAISLATGLRFTLDNYGMLQMTIFLLYSILESLRLLKEEKIITGCALLAFVINIKILPVVILPYLVYRGKWKAFIGTISFSVLFLIIPSLAVGWSSNLQLLAEWWEVINPVNEEHLLETTLGPHSLTALIPTLLMKTEGVFDFSRNITTLNLETVNFILNAVRLLLVLAVIYFVKWPPFRAARNTFHNIHELAYILVLIPLIFPHQQKYAFFMAVPAQIYMAYFIIYHLQIKSKLLHSWRWKIIMASFVLSFVLMTLTTDGLIGRDLNRITQYYKLITYGTFMLIVSLALSRPTYFEKDVRGLAS